MLGIPTAVAGSDDLPTKVGVEWNGGRRYGVQVHVPKQSIIRHDQMTQVELMTPK